MHPRTDRKLRCATGPELRERTRNQCKWGSSQCDCADDNFRPCASALPGPAPPRLALTLSHFLARARALTNLPISVKEIHVVVVVVMPDGNGRSRCAQYLRFHKQSMQGCSLLFCLLRQNNGFEQHFPSLFGQNRVYT